MAPDDDRRPEERRDYTVYRSRPRLLDRLRAPDLSRLRRPGRGGRRPGGTRRRSILRWALAIAAAWAALSIVMFAISSQIQKGKLDAGAKELLGGGSNLITEGKTILIIGSDKRDSKTNEPGSEDDPARADTIMLIRAGGGSFRKLSIPRDAFAQEELAEAASESGESVQGNTKINSAYAFGGPELQVRTVEKFLDIKVDHLVEVDFEGFRDFIDALGGVKVKLDGCVRSEINGGKKNGGFTLKLKKGENVLNGEEALALARTRKNECDPSQDDRDRAKRQQLILSGIKSRLSSPFRFPINFLKGPWLGWTAPKATVSDMGPLTMSELLFASIVGGDSKPRLVKATGQTPGGDLIIPPEERQRAVRKLLKG
jgi:LCP family protein required for cell wall assembly